MQELLEQCYCQSLELKRKDGTQHSELCVVSLSLAELREYAKSFLHPREFSYFSSLAYERRQLSYLLGRFAAKQALVHYGMEAVLTDMWIEPGVFDFPVIHYPGNEKIQLSDSHTETYGVALIYPEIHPMGIDLEILDAKKNSTIETVLTKEELQLLNNLAGMQTDEKYALFWTVKEALSKVLRTGLTTPFEIYAVKTLNSANNHWISEFQNFTQYKGVSFLLGHFMCSIVFPKRTEMTIDIPAIQTWFIRHIRS
jgi:4'-phosphopantetheinyl transferase